MYMNKNNFGYMDSENFKASRTLATNSQFIKYKPLIDKHVEGIILHLIHAAMAEFKWYAALLVVGMLVTGSINTLTKKAQNQSTAVGRFIL